MPVWLGLQFSHDDSSRKAPPVDATVAEQPLELAMIDHFIGLLFNSGMLSAIQRRGDVKGVFVGHDHTNTYVGDYYGVKLGYGPGTGFGPYGSDGDQKHRLRGCRVFDVDENAKDIWTGTRLVFAKDFGMDLCVPKQPMMPLPLGRRQR